MELLLILLLFLGGAYWLVRRSRRRLEEMSEANRMRDADERFTGDGDAGR